MGNDFKIILMNRILHVLIFIAITGAFSAKAQGFTAEWQGKINSGKELYAQNKYKNALVEFRAASQIIPTDTTAFIYVLDCAFKIPDPALVYKTIDDLRFLKAEKVAFYLMAGITARDVEEDYPKALSFLTNGLLVYPNHAELKMEEAILYYKAADYGVAYTKLEKLNTDQVPNYKVINMMLSITMDIQQDYTMALDVIKQAQTAFPDSVYFQEQEANIYLRTHDFATAQVVFENIIASNPRDPKAYYNLALLFFHQGNYETSASICLNAIEIDPNYLDAIYNVGTFYYWNGLNYNTALSDMNVYQYEEQGDEFERMAIENFEAAKPYFEKAIELNSDELDAFENLNTINVLLKNLRSISDLKNTKVTVPSETIVTETGKADLYISNLFFEYPENGKLKKGQTGYVNFKIENLGNATAKQIQAISITPIIIPGLSYERITQIDTVAAGSSLSVKLPIAFLTNNAQTQGIERLEGAENKMRVVIRASDNIKTEMVEFTINIGGEPVMGDETVVVAQTEAIDYFNPKPVARNFLFLIGINEYTEWPALANAVNDVHAVKDMLLSKYDFEPDFVYELYDKDATQQNIRNELIKIKRDITPNDNLVLYYAGHGYYDGEFDEGSWIPVNAGYGVETDYMANSRLVKYLDKIACKHMLLLADACFSGSLFVKDNRISYESGNDKIQSRWALTSGNMEEVADGIAGTNSPFASSLVEFLGNNRMQHIPVTELISFVSYKVKNETATTTAQTPIGKPLDVEGNQGGEFLLYAK